MKLNLKIVTLSSTILIYSCGGGETENPIIDEDSNELAGIWTTNCVIDGPESYKSTVTLSDDTYSIEAAEYNDNVCSIVNDSFTESGTFSIGESIITSSGLTANKWDVTQLIEDGVEEVSTTYDIIRVDDGKLYQGKKMVDTEFDGKTAEKRPIELDLDFVFYKI